MQFIPAPGIIEVFMSHTINTRPGKGWVLHYQTTAISVSELDMLDLSAALVNWWNVHQQPLMNASCKLDIVRCRDLTSQNSYVTEYTTGLPLGGTRVGSSVAGQVVLSIKKSTGLAGRNYRGRVYQFGAVETDGDGNTLGSTYISNVEAAWNEALFLSGAINDFAMVLVSRFQDGQPRSEAVVTPILNMVAVDNRVDTNRTKLH